MKTYRKTVPIADVVAQVNKMLADSIDEKVEGREALAVFIQRILMDAEVYAGFMYLQIERDPETDEVVTFGDESRRHYWFEGDTYNVTPRERSEQGGAY